MNENLNVNLNENLNATKSVLTVRNIIRTLAMLCIAFVFCPSFLVSCSGQKLEISTMDLVTGISMYGEKSDPYPALIICLILPAVILGVLIVKTIAGKKAALISLVCSGADLGIWMFVKSAIKKAADEYYCSFETTGWYTANLIVLVLLILVSCMVLIGKAHLDGDLKTACGSDETRETIRQMSSAVSQVSDSVTKAAGDIAGSLGNKAARKNAIGFCSKCGAPIAPGNRFCTSCGAPVPESLLAEAAKQVSGTDVNENR